MIERYQLLAHAASQAMQHIGQSDRGERRQVELERGKQVRLAQGWFEPRKAPVGPPKAVPVDVEQDEPLKLRSARSIEEVAGTHARFEMIGREVGAVKLKQMPRRAAPGERVRNAVDEH